MISGRILVFYLLINSSIAVLSVLSDIQSSVLVYWYTIAGPLRFSAASACSSVITSAGSLGMMPCLIAWSMPAVLGGVSIVLFEIT